MKGKITYRLKPPLTKKHFKVGTGNWMRCQEVVSVWDKKINSWISKVKQYEGTMANEQSQNGRGQYQIDEITYTKGGYC